MKTSVNKDGKIIKSVDSEEDDTELVERLALLTIMLFKCYKYVPEGELKETIRHIRETSQVGYLNEDGSVDEFKVD